MSKELELGILVVVVLKARNLNDKHSFYKQDVFAQATLNGMIHSPCLECFARVCHPTRRRQENPSGDQRWPAPYVGCRAKIPGHEASDGKEQKT